MSAPGGPAKATAGSARAMPKGLKPFKPGQSGNPSGRSKEIAEVEALARSKSAQAITELMRIAKGRGLAAVRAAETVLAYGLGRPQHQVSITAKGAPLDGRFAGAARQMLEAAISEAERSTDGATEPGVIDVQSVPITAVKPSATVSQTVAPLENHGALGGLTGAADERGPTTAPTDSETGGAP
jgi:hypothetical protein